MHSQRGRWERGTSLYYLFVQLLVGLFDFDLWCGFLCVAWVVYLVHIAIVERLRDNRFCPTFLFCTDKKETKKLPNDENIFLDFVLKFTGAKNSYKTISRYCFVFKQFVTSSANFKTKSRYFQMFGSVNEHRTALWGFAVHVRFDFNNKLI